MLDSQWQRSIHSWWQGNQWTGDQFVLIVGNQSTPSLVSQLLRYWNARDKYDEDEGEEGTE